MIRRALSLLCLCLAVHPSRGEELTDMRAVDGRCEASSHIAEGPIGADLTKRQSRFFCDMMAVMAFGANKDHTLIQFLQKQAHHGQIIGYAGLMAPGQNILIVDHVYLKEGEPTQVTEGYCKFFYQATRISGVSCGAKIDEDGRRTVPIITFEASPGQ
jgi:hypothetical protein